MGTAKNFLYVSLPSYRLIDSFSLEAALTLRKRVDVTHGITETFQYYSFAEDAGVNDEETWEIRLRTVQSLLPLGTAAYLMARFYVMAIEAVESYIGRLDDVEEWALRIGEVTLEVFCRNFICFNIIEEFLKKMEQLAGNGLVGMFEGHIVNVATGLTTWVKLSIKAPRPRPD